ncbi:hypothetical protein [Pseudomonas sp. Leaf127]|uniref:hypothetical protein n=1 Tax=Pseudomonas sp. Leaf127 TaxID=1736267 RepID=UPI000A439A1C
MHAALSLSSEQTFFYPPAQVPKMNMILTALNATALVALVTFHFQGTASQETQLNNHAQIQHTLRQTPQLAIMADKGANPAMLTNDAQQMPQATSSAAQRWVF